jgi:hypothetical protein
VPADRESPRLSSPETSADSPDEKRFRQICADLKPGETAVWCAEYGLPTSGFELAAARRAAAAREAAAHETAESRAAAATDEEREERYRRICTNLKRGETAVWCAEYGLPTGISETETHGQTTDAPVVTRRETNTAVGSEDSIGHRIGKAAIYAGKVAIAVPVIAVLAPIWVLSKLGEGMSQNPAATAVLLQQLNANRAQVSQPAQPMDAVSAAALLAPSRPSAASCPTGSFPWTDNWGNKICKRFGDGSTATIQSITGGCPTGSYPWVDNWGNHICQAFGNDQRYYDTSRGCPTGSYPWVDEWGNKTCKSF